MYINPKTRMRKKIATNGSAPPNGLRFEWLDPKAGQANPLNWRTHPAHQTEALKSLIYDEPDVGWAGVALLNERRVEDGWDKKEAVPTFIDGHDRRELALSNGGKLPTLIGRWSPAGERKILAFLDRVGTQAVTDAAALEYLVRDIETESGPLQSMLEDISRDLEASQLREPAEKHLGAHGGRTSSGEIAVRPVLTVKDVALFEEAMQATGDRNRASALMILARTYLEQTKSKGQLNLRSESLAPDETHYGDEFDLSRM